MTMSSELTGNHGDATVRPPTQRPLHGSSWVVDTPTRSLWLQLVSGDVTSSWSSALTAAVDHDVTTILATFDRAGRKA